MTGSRAQRVVVGVDETSGSMAALAFAMREAALRGSSLDVITAWISADEDHSALGNDARHDELPERARRRAQNVQDRAVALTLQEVDVRPLLSRQVLGGDAGQVLVRVAREADYLVVGVPAAGLRRPGSLDSVSDYCLRHATCAVVVVRTPARKPRMQQTEGACDASRQRTTSGRLS
ncbi:MAG: universal stress protein [Nocardioidaceae bacterium]